MPAATATSSALVATVLLCASVFLAAHQADGRHVDGSYQKPKKGYDLVRETCRNATDLYSVPRLTMEFCVSALQSDKRSAEAKHPRDLALVAIDLLQRGAADADAKIRAMARGNHSKDTELAWQFCRMDYDNLARTLPLCRAVVQDYKPGSKGDLADLRVFDNFMKCADRLSNPAVGCWFNIFFDGTMQKAAMKEIIEAGHRGNLADAMISQTMFLDT